MNMPKMMRGPELQRWKARNLRENTGYTLKLGDRFMDQFWVWNTVIDIDGWDADEPQTIENHGCITTRQEDGSEEHYAMWNWQEHFRIDRLEDQKGSVMRNTAQYPITEDEKMDAVQWAVNHAAETAEERGIGDLTHIALLTLLAEMKAKA